MLKLAKLTLVALAFTMINFAHADPAVDQVLDDIQKGYSGGYSYSSTNRCSTTKACNDYLQQKLKQLIEKYSSDQKKSTLATQTQILGQQIEVAKNLSQQIPALLKSAIYYPQQLVFRSMSSQGQTKYRQGTRYTIPNFDQGFDLLSINRSNLNANDSSILEAMEKEILDLSPKQGASYLVKNIKGIQLTYDDILNSVLDALNTMDYTNMDRDKALALQLSIIDDIKGRLASDDPSISKLQQLRSTIESEGHKSPIGMEALILFLQMNYQDPSAKLENESEQAWLNASQSFAQPKSTQQPNIANLGNLEFDVTASGKTYHLSAKTIITLVKDKQRFYSQITVYKEMTPAAQADYRAGKRYTFVPSVIASHLFDPLKATTSDQTQQDSLERLQDEISETLKDDLKTKAIPPAKITEVLNASYDIDQVLNAILQEIDSAGNRPTDREANLIIDLGIVDKYLQTVDQNDKGYQKLLALRQKIESGQETTSTYDSNYNTYGYSSNTYSSNKSQADRLKNKSRENWEKIKKQCSPEKSAVPAKITNLNDVTVKFTAAGKSYSVSLATAGAANYARRRLSTSTKYSTEKADVLKELVRDLRALGCKSREDCRRVYSDEIKSMKSQFGRSGYSNQSSYSNYNYGSSYSTYSSSSKSSNRTQKTQEIDAAIQEMLENFAAVIGNAFDIDRPQTKLVLYKLLSQEGQSRYLDGTRIGSPKQAHIFSKSTEKEKKKGKGASALFQSVLSLFGGGQPAIPAEPTAQEQKADKTAAEKELLPYALFNRDDILIYTIQALDKNTSSCKTYSDCANTDIRLIGSVIKLLNKKDPVIHTLYEVIDQLKADQKTNPLDLDSIAGAFKKAKYSAKVKLEPQDAKEWDQIEAKKNKKRSRPIAPRINNQSELIKFYNKRTQNGKKPTDFSTSGIAGLMGTAIPGVGTIGSAIAPMVPTIPKITSPSAPTYSSPSAYSSQPKSYSGSSSYGSSSAYQNRPASQRYAQTG